MDARRCEFLKAAAGLLKSGHLVQSVWRLHAPVALNVLVQLWQAWPLQCCIAQLRLTFLPIVISYSLGPDVPQRPWRFTVDVSAGKLLLAQGCCACIDCTVQCRDGLMNVIGKTRTASRECIRLYVHEWVMLPMRKGSEIGTLPKSSFILQEKLDQAHPDAPRKLLLVLSLASRETPSCIESGITFFPGTNLRDCTAETL